MTIRVCAGKPGYGRGFVLIGPLVTFPLNHVFLHAFKRRFPVII